MGTYWDKLNDLAELLKDNFDGNLGKVVEELKETLWHLEKDLVRKAAHHDKP